MTLTLSKLTSKAQMRLSDLDGRALRASIERLFGWV